MYLNYCRGLRFEEAPDYMYLRQLFRILFRTLNHTYDYTFDWTLLKQKAAQVAASGAGGEKKGDAAAAAATTRDRPRGGVLPGSVRKPADVGGGLETGGAAAAAAATGGDTAVRTDAAVHGSMMRSEDVTVTATAKSSRLQEQSLKDRSKRKL